MTIFINLISLIFTMLSGWMSILGGLGLDGIIDLLGGVE